MFTDTYFQLFKAPFIQRPSHMLTDVPFWSQQFALLASLNVGHSEGLQKVIARQQQYLDTLKQTGLKGKDEKRFHREVQSINEIISGHLESLTHSIIEHAKTEHRLKRFKDDSLNCTKELDRAYRKAREDLEKQTHVVEAHRQKYHKLAFHVEKAEIKVKLADGSGVLRAARKRLNVLQYKTEVECLNYSEQLEKWKCIFSKVQMLSTEYEMSYLSREGARAELVLSCLQNIADGTIAGKFDRRDPVFTAVDARRFIKERLIEREVIQVPLFQVYVGEIGKHDTYERAKAELEVTLDANNSSQGSNSGFDPRDLAQTFAVNKKLSAHTIVFTVVQGYQKQHVNQLNLKPGDRIKQILPANENGLAYGQVSRSLYKKTHKGYFPVSCVVQAQKGQPETY